MEWIISSALLISLYCLVFFGWRVCRLWQGRENEIDISLLLLVKNQEKTIEGLVRTVLAGGERAEIIAVDLDSTDQTKLILDRLTRRYHNLCYLRPSLGAGFHELRSFCSGQTIYCLDLTSQIEYPRMADTISSILKGSAAA